VDTTLRVQIRVTRWSRLRLLHPWGPRHGVRPINPDRWYSAPRVGGREAELRVLDNLRDSVCSAQSAALVVRGEPGITRRHCCATRG